MRCAEGDAQSCAARRHGRRPDRGHPQALQLQRGRQGQRIVASADDQRLNGRLRLSQLPASRAHQVAQHLGHAAPESGDERRQMAPSLLALVAAHQPQAGAHRMRHCWRLRGGVDVGPGALRQPLDDGAMRRDEGPGDPRRLAQRAHADQPLAAQADVRQHAAPLRAEHAEAVRIVHDEVRVMPLGQRQQLGQVCQIAVHAEHPVGHDQLAWRAAGRDAALQARQIVVRVGVDSRLGQPRTIDQRGVVQQVGVDRGLCIAQRGQQRQVGHVAGAERQCAQLGPLRRQHLGEIIFQQRMCARMATDQVRGTAAGTVPPRTLGQRLDQQRMVGQAQVIVAAEGEQLPRRSIVRSDGLQRRAGGFGDAAMAAQRLRLTLGQLLFQVLQHRRVSQRQALTAPNSMSPPRARRGRRHARRSVHTAASGTRCGRSGGSAGRARGR